jgi:hypothetical protein
VRVPAHDGRHRARDLERDPWKIVEMVAPRLSIVTLGVADVARSRAFYEALG